MPREANKSALPANPFVYVWLGTGLLLNITGLASVAADAVKWIEFFANLWSTYRIWVREPIFKLMVMVWPYWLPPLPRTVTDVFVIWSGLWIAISIYHYQVAGKLKLAEVFENKRDEVNETLFFSTRLYWMIVELIASARAAAEVTYCYLTLPILYIYYSVFGRAPLQMPLSDAHDRVDELSTDVERIGTLVEFQSHIEAASIEGVDRGMALRSRTLPREIRKVFVDRIERRDRRLPRPPEAALDDEDKVLATLKDVRKEIISERTWLEKAIDTQYLVLAARQVLTYYACILALFLCVLFVNYTALGLGVS